MIKKLCCAFVYISTVFWLQSNGQALNSGRHKYTINPKLPSVYITVDPSAKRDKLAIDLKDGRVFLNLHNNLRWSIHIAVGPTEPVSRNVRIDYDVLIGGESVVSRECHVCTVTEVKSGSSVSFHIPQSDLVDSKRLRIRYSYAWENWIDSEAQREPWHYVFFAGAQE